jgi:hemerythrin-like metal-binding protein
MAYLEWDQNYSVGLNEIDEQHKKFISLINSLYDAMSVGQSKAVLDDLIRQLSEYAIYHFHLEEKYMQDFNYPEFEEHKKLHESFTQKIEQFKNEYYSGKLLLSVEIITYMKDWLLHHILIADYKFSDLFKEKGII